MEKILMIEHFNHMEPILMMDRNGNVAVGHMVEDNIRLDSSGLIEYRVIIDVDIMDNAHED